MTTVGLLFPAEPEVVQLPLGERVAVALMLVVPVARADALVEFPEVETVATNSLDDFQETEETEPQLGVTVTLLAMVPKRPRPRDKD